MSEVDDGNGTSIVRQPSIAENPYEKDEEFEETTKERKIRPVGSDDSGFASQEGIVEMVPMGVGGWGGPDDDWDMEVRPTNEKLLTTAFLSFMLFTIVQSVAAYIAKSEAMMGDSAAMFVDALTYLFNLVAERRKNRFDELWKGTHETDPARIRHIRKRDKRKMTLNLELIPPLISVGTLLAVIAFVLHKAVQVLLLDVHRKRSQQGNPNINLMLFFSVLNLFLDGLNVFCFAKAKRLFGYKTATDKTAHEPDMPDDVHDTKSKKPRRPNKNYEYLNNEQSSADDDVEEANGHAADVSRADGLEPDQTKPASNGSKGDQILYDAVSHIVFSNDDDETLSNGVVDENVDYDDCPRNDQDAPNLNMCSAYTHVFADTLRSIAVVIASCIAELVDGVTPEEADATAAIIVSFLILLSLIPLFHGLVSTFSELRMIRAEERSERMFPENANRTENELAIQSEDRDIT